MTICTDCGHKVAAAGPGGICIGCPCDKWHGPAKAPPLPHQRFEVTLRISAHSWPEACRTAQELADHIHEHGPVCSLVGGGRIVDVREDPAMTREQYEADLHAYVEATRGARP